MANGQQLKGIVKWFNKIKRYGFIAPEGGGQDVFVHISAVEKSGIGDLREGQRITFDKEVRGDKTSAINLRAAWTEK